MTFPSTSLPPDPRSPALARRHLRDALGGAGLDHVLDDALVLVTELVTNAVVHAGTALDLHLDATAPGLRVEVVDRGPGSSLLLPTPVSQTAESGRGLRILHALASRWGTTHGPGCTAVWFELDREPPARPSPSPAAMRPAAMRSAAIRPAHAGAAAPELPWSLLLPDDLLGRLDPAEVLLELVHRLGDELGLDDVHLLVARDGTGEWSPAAVRGAPPQRSALVGAAQRAGATTGPVLRSGADLVLPLPGRDGALGALVLSGAGGLDATGTALARLVAERLAATVREARTDAAVTRQRGSLALLAEASEMFAGTLDVQLAVTLAAQLVVPRFARWAAVHTVFDREPRLDAVAHSDEEQADALRAGLAEAGGRALAAGLTTELAAHRPVLLGPAALPEEVRGHAPGDVLALPLVARHRLIGSLLVAHGPGAPFAASDVEVLLDLARRAALAVDNARLYEERTGVARALQASLLPPDLPRAAHVDFGARYVAAGEGNEVGGDFYDVVALPDGGWAVAIGDVCGKGAEAAAITGLARNVLRLLLRQGAAPSVCLRELNAAILDLDERGRFVTGAVATLHVEGDDLVLRMCVAGHPSPVHLRSCGPPVLVGRNGTVLGVTPDVDLEDERVRLTPGEAVVLYTDGVTERRRGLTMFGEETLLAVLGAAGRLSADAVAGRVEQAVRSFGPEASRDDLAVLVVRAAEVSPVQVGPARTPSRRVTASSSATSSVAEANAVGPGWADGVRR